MSTSRNQRYPIIYFEYHNTWHSLTGDYEITVYIQSRKFSRLPQGNQLLCTCRVDSNTAIKVLLCSAHFHGNAETLQHLSDAQAEDMQAHHLLFRPGNHKLKLGGILLLLLRREDVIVHRSEAGVIDLDIGIAEALAGFGLGETDSADFGVGEDYSGDVLV